MRRRRFRRTIDPGEAVTDHADHDDTTTEDEGLPIITFENEEGEILEFVQLIVFELEDTLFAALTPAAELGQDDVELYVFRTGEDERGRFFDPVEDDAQAQRVFDIAVELLGGDAGEPFEVDEVGEA
jgi:hypothetical protein